MSNDFIKAGADILISSGETKRHVKKIVAENKNQILGEIELQMCNAIHLVKLYCAPLGEIEDAFEDTMEAIQSFEKLIVGKRSLISDELFDLVEKVPIECVSYILTKYPKDLSRQPVSKTPEFQSAHSNVQRTDLDGLQGKISRQIKKDRENLLRGKLK